MFAMQTLHMSVANVLYRRNAMLHFKLDVGAKQMLSTNVSRPRRLAARQRREVQANMRENKLLFFKI